MGWSGGLAEWIEDDVAYLSVVFSWLLPKAYQRAAWLKAEGYQVRAGGPAVWIIPKYLEGVAESGGEVDAITRHNPRATMASRGCPVGCWFCIVPTMEGKEFELIWDFIPRPILCDNNLSALPGEFQDHIIKRYKDEGVVLEDANSGFEPRTFTDEVYARWKEFYTGPWRFALDDINEIDYVEQVLKMLNGIHRNDKRVYTLIGNEPFEVCHERVLKTIEWGGLPFAQPVMALNTLTKIPIVRHDWNKRLLKNYARWVNRYLWKYTSFDEYKPGGKTNGKP